MPEEKEWKQSPSPMKVDHLSLEEYAELIRKFQKTVSNYGKSVENSLDKSAEQS